MLSWHRIYQALLLLGLVSLLTACGFQLRGSYQVPEALQKVSVDAPMRSELSQRLLQEFERHGITVVERSDQHPHIELRSDQLDRRVLSLLISGQVAEYELIYTAPLRVEFPSGRVAVHEVQILRDYQEDPNFALAKTRELELLIDEMRDDAVQRIMMLLTRLALE